MYRGTPSWEIDEPDPELVRALDTRDIRGPGRAIDLGCGTGDNAVALAQRGFDVVGIDLSDRALTAARRKAAAAGVDVDFRVENMTALDACEGRFHLIVDRGLLMSLPGERQRRSYVAILDRLLTETGHIYEAQWTLPSKPRFPTPSWVFARTKAAILGFEELERRFGRAFTIERLVSSIEPVDDRMMRLAGLRRIAKVSYWMTRKNS